METHGIRPGVDRNQFAESPTQITCSDCGHVYFVEAGLRSGACRVCGNIEFLGDQPAEPKTGGRALGALSEEITARRILPRLRAPAGPVDPLAVFRVTPDGHTVESLRVRYQVEWQLWAELVHHFGDPAYHAAYLATVVAGTALKTASERYQEHRAVMALLPDSRWQADVADLMLARIESLSLARLAMEKVDHGFDLPAIFQYVPYRSRAIKAGWLAIGAFAAMFFARLFGF